MLPHMVLVGLKWVGWTCFISICAYAVMKLEPAEPEKPQQSWSNGQQQKQQYAQKQQVQQPQQRVWSASPPPPQKGGPGSVLPNALTGLKEHKGVWKSEVERVVNAAKQIPIVDGTTWSVDHYERYEDVIRAAEKLLGVTARKESPAYVHLQEMVAILKEAAERRRPTPTVRGLFDTKPF